MIAIGLCAFFVVVLVATGIVIATRRLPPQPGEAIRVKEIGFTVLLALLLWLEAGMVLYYAFTVPERLFINQNSIINVSIFLLLSILIGAVAMLFYFVKCITADAEGVIYHSFWGVSSRIIWSEVTGFGKANGKRLTLMGKNNEKLTVGGDREKVKEFIKYAETYLPKDIDKEQLDLLKISLKMR